MANTPKINVRIFNKAQAQGLQSLGFFIAVFTTGATTESFAKTIRKTVASLATPHYILDRFISRAAEEGIPRLGSRKCGRVKHGV